MAIWSLIASKLKEILTKMIGARTIEQTLHVAPVISSQMEEAIQRWGDMYKNQAPWLHEPTFNDKSRVVSLGLPAMIASEKARMALLELNSEITTPTKEVEIPNPEYPAEPKTILQDGKEVPVPTAQVPQTITEDRPVSNTKRAEYLELQYKKLKKQLRKQIEYGIAKGGLVIKPYVVMSKDLNADYSADIEFDFIQADCFYPLAFDASGHITEAAFLQTRIQQNIVYRRLEYHKWENNTVRVINKAFKSTNNAQASSDMVGVDLGQEIPLTEVNEWKDLSPSTTIANVKKPMFAYFKMPEANTVDPSSPLGVSGFSRAEELIKDADIQYSTLLWEYEGGSLAIDIDRDALSFFTDAQGNQHQVMSKLQERLYRPIDLGESDTYQPYTPTLRDANYIQGLNSILMRIEDVTGLSRGTLSDPVEEARTATELKILKQRSYQTNADIQTAIEDAIKDVIYIMDVYCTLYKITPEGEYDVNFEWDDSIITDIDEELNKRILLQQNGLASKLENRMWYFGETERQAKEALAKIDDENRQQMEENMMFSQDFNDVNEGSVNQ